MIVLNRLFDVYDAGCNFKDVISSTCSNAVHGTVTAFRQHCAEVATTVDALMKDKIGTTVEETCAAYLETLPPSFTPSAEQCIECVRSFTIQNTAVILDSIIPNAPVIITSIGATLSVGYAIYHLPEIHHNITKMTNEELHEFLDTLHI